MGRNHSVSEMPGYGVLVHIGVSHLYRPYLTVTASRNKQKVVVEFDDKYEQYSLLGRSCRSSPIFRWNLLVPFSGLKCKPSK